MADLDAKTKKKITMWQLGIAGFLLAAGIALFVLDKYLLPADVVGRSRSSSEYTLYFTYIPLGNPDTVKNHLDGRDDYDLNVSIGVDTVTFTLSSSDGLNSARSFAVLVPENAKVLQDPLAYLFGCNMRVIKGKQWMNPTGNLSTDQGVFRATEIRVEKKRRAKECQAYGVNASWELPRANRRDSFADRTMYIESVDVKDTSISFREKEFPKADEIYIQHAAVTLRLTDRGDTLGAVYPAPQPAVASSYEAWTQWEGDGMEIHTTDRFLAGLSSFVAPLIFLGVGMLLGKVDLTVFHLWQKDNVQNEV